MSLAGIGLGLPDPVPQRRVMHAQLLGKVPNHRLRSDSRYRRTARGRSSSRDFFGAAMDDFPPMIISS
jgi:hypothetical protein